MNSKTSSKFWKPFLEVLEKGRDGYYIGGTLCIDLPSGLGCAFNLDGTGFLYGGNGKYLSNRQVYPPPEVTEYVRLYYTEYKNNLEYLHSQTKE